MKKKVFALLATLILTFAFTANCFAAPSPGHNVLPTEEKPTPNGGGNGSGKSPQTGSDAAVAGAFVAIITASGVALVSRKKYAEAE